MYQDNNGHKKKKEECINNLCEKIMTHEGKRKGGET